MTMIVLDDGSLVPLSAVERLRPVSVGDQDPYMFDVIGANGRHLGSAYKYAVDAIVGTLMPAAAGWRVGIFADDRDPDFGIWLEPVVAWRIGDEGPRPITPTGETFPESHLIVAPDGYTALCDSDAWASLEEAETALRERWRLARAERMAAA
jgi:hypothetical protein